MFFRNTLLLVCFLCLTSLSCTRRDSDQGSIRRVAVFPFEDLTGDRSLFWFSRAVSRLIVMATPGSQAPLTIDGNEASLGWVTHRLDGQVAREQGTLVLRTQLRDLTTQKVVSRWELRGKPEEVWSIAAQTARHLGREIQEPGTTSAQALRALFEASRASDPTQLMGGIDAALQVDPNFGGAHLARAQALLTTGDRAGALAALEAIRGKTSVRFTPEERGQIQMIMAGATEDAKPRAEAAATLANARPLNLDVQRSAADLAMLARQYGQAAEFLGRATSIDDSDPRLWNALAYAHTFAGKHSEAESALGKQQALQPNEPAVRDAMGEINYLSGRFDRAESHFLDAHQVDPKFGEGSGLYRAAISALMQGNRERADAHFAKYLDHRKPLNDPLLGVKQAVWHFSTGRRSQAVRELDSIASPPIAVVNAQCLLALIEHQFGDVTKSQAHLSRAASIAQANPAIGQALPLTAFLLRPVDLKPDPLTATRPDMMQRQVAGYNLLLHQKFADAAQVLRWVWERTPPQTGGDERALLTWAEAGRGNWTEVPKVLTHWPLPPRAPDPGPTTILFPRVVYLKAQAEKMAGKQQEARRLFKLFLELSKDRPFAFGEESTAQAELTKLGG